MYLKEVSAEFEGHRIEATNSWGFERPAYEFKSEARLFIDGRLVDTNSALTSVSKKAPLLTGIVVIGTSTHQVEVFIRAIFRVRMKICVDGRKIAGDLR